VDIARRIIWSALVGALLILFALPATRVHYTHPLAPVDILEWESARQNRQALPPDSFPLAADLAERTILIANAGKASENDLLLAFETLRSAGDADPKNAYWPLLESVLAQISGKTEIREAADRRAEKLETYTDYGRVLREQELHRIQKETGLKHQYQQAFILTSQNSEILGLLHEASQRSNTESLIPSDFVPPTIPLAAFAFSAPAAFLFSALIALTLAGLGELLTRWGPRRHPVRRTLWAALDIAILLGGIAADLPILSALCCALPCVAALLPSQYRPEDPPVPANPILNRLVVTGFLCAAIGFLASGRGLPALNFFGFGSAAAFPFGLLLLAAPLTASVVRTTHVGPAPDYALADLLRRSGSTAALLCLALSVVAVPYSLSMTHSQLPTP